jgi:hypothetical protein
VRPFEKTLRNTGGVTNLRKQNLWEEVEEETQDGII